MWLRGNEQLRANHSGRLPKMSESLIRSFWAINEQFARKTDEQIPSTDFFGLKDWTKAKMRDIPSQSSKIWYSQSQQVST